VDEPAIKPDEILIRVRAAGLNRADILQRAGFYPPPPGASEIIGLECAGEVAAVGAAVTNSKGWCIYAAPGDVPSRIDEGALGGEETESFLAWLRPQQCQGKFPKLGLSPLRSRAGLAYRLLRARDHARPTALVFGSWPIHMEYWLRSHSRWD
jgi:hypothetical protein